MNPHAVHSCLRVVLLMLQPVYTSDNTASAFQLNWSLVVRFREQRVARELWLEDLTASLENDGIRILRYNDIRGKECQFMLSTKPTVSPLVMVQRVKGRLHHLLRHGARRILSRNYSVMSVGSARREIVEDYVARQLERHPLADPRTQQRLEEVQRKYHTDLSVPLSSAHGIYTYNLHIVLRQHSGVLASEQELRHALTAIDGTAKKHGFRLSRVGLPIDHIHLTLGCPMKWTPEDVALSFMNNCSFKFGMQEVFRPSYYVGTVGEFDRGACL